MQLAGEAAGQAAGHNQGEDSPWVLFIIRGFYGPFGLYVCRAGLYLAAA